MTQEERKSNIKGQNNGYIHKNKSAGANVMADESSDKNKNNHLTDANSCSQW